MYDLPGFSAETDALWALIRDALLREGVDAPADLSRSGDEQELWTRPDLVVSQTCGLPLVTGLAGDATVLGAFDFGLPGCAAGFYASVIVALAEDVLHTERPSYAFNMKGSQSGYAALKRRRGDALGEGVETGSHHASARLVAQGGAQIAALDAMSWRLIKQIDPDVTRLRVVDQTQPTPGLPLITAQDRDPAPFRRALDAAAAAYAQGENRLGIRGFVPFDRSDYEAAIFPVD